MRDTDPITSELSRIRPGELLIVGAPWEGGSSHLQGTAKGPARIRQELLSPARHLVTEGGDDLGGNERFRLLGDVPLPDQGPCNDALEAAAEQVLEQRGRLLTLGGDHSVTVGLMRAYSKRFPGLTLLQIDAHPDLYEEFNGDRWSHACPMARILEEHLVGRLVQVGVRTMTPEQRIVAERHGVEVMSMDSWDLQDSAALALVGPVYVSLDLDGLDPAFAPGVSHPEPGGLTTRQTLSLIQDLPQPLVGADLVELNPTRDPQGLTAVLAGKLVKELAARILEEDFS